MDNLDLEKSQFFQYFVVPCTNIMAALLLVAFLGSQFTSLCNTPLNRLSMNLPEPSKKEDVTPSQVLMELRIYMIFLAIILGYLSSRI